MATISHLRAHALIQAAADRTLSPRERVALDSHLAECNECHLYSEKLNQLQEDVRHTFRNRWNRNVPTISIDLVKQRSRRIVMRRKVLNTAIALGVMTALVAAFLLIDTSLRRPVSPLTSPGLETEQTSTLTVTTGSESIEPTYLDRLNAPSPFPPVGIATICSNTAPNPIDGTGKLIWPSQDHFLSGMDFSDLHPAIDIAGNTGDPVYAADNGVAVVAGWSIWGYGNLIILDHGNSWYSLYGHLDQINVTCGQNVKQGDVIGLIGKSGNTANPQLHFEVLYNNSFVNPWTVLPPPGDCSKIEYVVQENDTLERIAVLYMVPAKSILDANGMASDNNILNTGMHLVIPLCR
jgi:murein DD-endopeptidase MepM/ murein hydrolase activator NlpD